MSIFNQCVSNTYIKVVEVLELVVLVEVLVVDVDVLEVLVELVEVLVEVEVLVLVDVEVNGTYLQAEFT